VPVRAKLAVLVLVAVAAVAALVASRAAAPAGRLSAAFDAEFLVRPDGYPGLSRHYHLEFAGDPLQMDPGLMYMALAEGAVDVIDGFSTDGRIAAYGLLALEDDRRFFPPYQAAPLVRSETLKTHPRLGEVLKTLAGRIDNPTMQRLNYRVDELGERAAEVAQDFLRRENLLKASGERRRSAQPLIVGGKHFTEQEILGEMLAILIEEQLGVPVVRKLNMGGTMICFNALRAGDIHLYPEYTGTGLVNILKQEAGVDPRQVLSKVQTEFEKRYGLVWLEPFGFDNTYAMVMKRQRAESLGISTISDLSRQVDTRSP
jgi:osmoprotectant transport system permease protein